MKIWMWIVICGVASLGWAGEAGPKGGKLLEAEPNHAEFWVNADGRVEVTFYSEDMKPLALAAQEVRITAQAPSGKAVLEMEKGADAFVSTTALPEGDGYNIVVQIKDAPEAQFQNFRVPYHAETCGECQRAEYACTCDHAAEAGGHEGHGH